MIKYYWLHTTTLYVAKIKSFLSKTPVKIQEIIQGAVDKIATTDMEQMEIYDANGQQEEMEYLLLQYLCLVMLTIEYFGI